MNAELAALGGAFVTGLGSSLGPCAAPRFLIAGACSADTAALPKMAAFAGGTIGGYFVYALAGSALGLLRASSHAIYAGMALALVIAGVANLRRGRRHRCSTASRPPIGGMFALGASSALTLSPCCTPIALALGMQASLGQDVALAAESLVAFGVGHALPMIGLTGGWSFMRRRYSAMNVGASGSVIGGTILIGVGAVYGVLA